MKYGQARLDEGTYTRAPHRQHAGDDHDVSTKGSPTVAKSRTPYHLKSLKSLKFRNLKSRTVETVISKFLYISASNHVKIGRTISNKLLVKVTNHETSKISNNFLRRLINTTGAYDF